MDQPTSYFLAVCGAAQYGCVYMMKRFVKRFREIGGNVEWLEGKFPKKIGRVLGLGHMLAYCPYEIKTGDIEMLLKGGDCWSIQELTQAASIMCFAQMASAFALAHGINP